MTQTPMLASERVVIQAPMSFHGAWIRTWRLMDFKGRTGAMPTAPRVAAGAALVIAGLVMLAAWWIFVAAWYLFFGLWLVPYRMIRRGSRKRKMENMRHREMLNTMQSGAAATHMPNIGPPVVMPAQSTPTLEGGGQATLPPAAE
jgi:hypothetical protein